jgi:hypothetical protein
MNNYFTYLGEDLSVIYVSMIFGLSAILINHELYENIKNNKIYAYIAAYIGFLFLQLLSERNATAPVIELIGKSIAIFILFVCIVNTKYKIVLLILFILFMTRIIEYQKIRIKKINTENDEKMKTELDFYNKISANSNNVLIISILLGFAYTTYLNYIANKSNFSFYKQLTKVYNK